MDKKFIDAEKFKNAIKENKLMAREAATRRILEMLEKQPHADVQEVKHAKWPLVSTYRDEEGYLNDIFRCSNCHIPFDENTRYCPCCGAKMQPDENKEEFNNA